MIHKGGQLVVQQIVVQGLTGLFIEQQLLAHTVADGHGHTAVDLGLRQGGIDKTAAVVNVDDLVQLDLAQGDVHLHIGEGATEGVGIVADGVGGFGGDVLAVRRVVLGGHGQFTQAHEHRAVLLADDIAVHDVHIIHGLAGQLGGVGQDLLPQQGGGLPDGEAGHIGLAAGVGAQTGGG